MNDIRLFKETQVIFDIMPIYCIFTPKFFINIKLQGVLYFNLESDAEGQLNFSRILIYCSSHSNQQNENYKYNYA